MNVEIRKLTPELSMDYVNFFDTTPHATNKKEHKCYCIWWCSDDIDGKDYSTVDKRRQLAIKYVVNSSIQGHLAYCDNKVVGWCNTNTKSDCYECFGWRNFMGSVRKEEATSNITVKSVFCYAIAPEMRGKGIARLLLEEVCKDAKLEGFDYVEAYPNREFINTAEDYMGPISMYEKSGFHTFYETKQKAVMKKSLK